MKILDVSEFYAERGGGVRTYVNQKLDAAKAAGVDMVVVAPGPEDRVEARRGGRVIWIKGPPMPLDPRYFLLLREAAVHQAIDDEAPDIIEGSSPWTGGWFAARYPGPAKKAFIFHQDPVAVYPHTFLDRWMTRDAIDRASGPYWAYLRRLSGHFDRTIVAGQWLAERLAGFGISNAEAVPFGIEKHRFSPRLFDPRLRAGMLESVGLSEDDHLLVGVSRHHPEKRVFTLLRAMEMLAGERINGRRVGFVMYGDGPMRRLVDRRAARIPNVRIAGFTATPEDLPRAMASGDAFLHGGAAETFGLVLGEALCSGLPLIIPTAGGSLDFLDPDYAVGYEPGDASDCRRAIVRLLRGDIAAMKSAALRARDERVLNVGDHFPALFDSYSALLSAN